MKIWVFILSFGFALVVLWAAGALVFAAYALNMTPQEPLRKTEAIVILTGGKDRIEEGLTLFSGGMAPHVFITGVNADVKREEVLALYKGEAPLPLCCIELGYEARTTVQNAVEAKAWLESTGFTTVRLVTGNYHMPRAQMLMRHAIPEVTFITHPVRQRDLEENKALLRNLLFTEYHKTVFRFVTLLAGMDMNAAEKKR